MLVDVGENQQQHPCGGEQGKMNPYRVVSALPPPPWWRRYLCATGMHMLELEYIEDDGMYDIWHHRCPFCGETSCVADIDINM